MFILLHQNLIVLSACLYAVFVQEHVTKMIGLRRSYQLGLAVFSLSMAITVLNTSRYGHSFSTYIDVLILV